MKNKCTKNKFLCDVDSHNMTILLNDGIYRHIRFQNPGTNVYMFDIITWPDHLCYTGDMGSFLFKRTEDMFMFFRNEKTNDEGLYINLSYWAEKCLAGDNVNGIKEYSPDTFVQAIEDYLTNDETTDTIRKNARNELLPLKDEGEETVRQAVSNYECKDGNEVFTFDDFFEYDLTDYTYHFVWCCYAIAWGVKMYDRSIKK